MSKPRYNWWGFALAMIRDYPNRQIALRDLRQQKNTDDPRKRIESAESIRLCLLPPQEQREYEAVHKAIVWLRNKEDAKLRMDVVKLTLWRGYTIPGAAIIVNVSETTARRYRWQFVMLVGRMYGFMTEEEYQTAIRKDMG